MRLPFLDRRDDLGPAFGRLLLSDAQTLLALMVGQVATPWWIAGAGGAHDLAVYGVFNAALSILAMPLMAPLGDRIPKRRLIRASLLAFPRGLLVEPTCGFGQPRLGLGDPLELRRQLALARHRQRAEVFGQLEAGVPLACGRQLRLRRIRLPAKAFDPRGQPFRQRLQPGPQRGRVDRRRQFREGGLVPGQLLLALADRLTRLVPAHVRIPARTAQILHLHEQILEPGHVLRARRRALTSEHTGGFSAQLQLSELRLDHLELGSRVGFAVRQGWFGTLH